MLIISFIFLYIEWYFVGIKTGFYESESYFMILPVCICLFSLILKIKPFMWKNSVYMKRASTVIYTLHGTLIPSIRYLWFNIININSSIFVFITDIVICILVYILIQKYIDKNKNSKLSHVLKWAY